MLRKLFYAALGAILTLGAVWAAQQPLPGIPGPSLGDSLGNLYTLSAAYVGGNGFGVSPALSVSQTSGATNCTQLDNVNYIQNITTSSSTGYVCLPTAYSGKELKIYNASGSTVDIYGSPTSYVPGTYDTINGSAGSSAYTAMTTHKLATCLTYINAAWICVVQ